VIRRPLVPVSCLTVGRIGSMFNASPGESKQNEVESWAKKCYPEVWEELTGMGMRNMPNGMRYCNIDRKVEP